MDWSRLFLSAEGRIGQKDYWIGVLILFVAWLLSSLAHILAPLIWIVLIYPWVCVIAKRLHDSGRSGWLILIPFLIGVVALCCALVVGGAAAIGALIVAFGDGDFDTASWTAVASAIGAALALIGLAGLVKFIFLLWVGLSAGDAGANRYGPAPGDTAAPTAPPPAPPATLA